LIQFLKAKNVDQFNSDTQEKIMATYFRLLRMSAFYWEEFIDYIINNQPNKCEILKVKIFFMKFCSTHSNGAGFKNGLIYLLLEESEKAWDSAELLRKSKQID
jgi:hypothetical protein